MNKSRFFLCAFIAVLVMNCTKAPEYKYTSGSTWGTTYHIKYKSDKDLSDSIIYIMHQVDMSLSPFQPNSTLSAINKGEDVIADKMIRKVLLLSQHVCSISDGAFDPTLAPLINMWGFGYKTLTSDAPTQQQIDSALLTVGINDCNIDNSGRLVRKSPLTEFNFSAIAKGFGIDCIADMLTRNGCTDYMVEIGGELSLKGNGPRGDKWIIQIDAPVVEYDTIIHENLTTIKLTDCGIATSGNYRNHRLSSQGEVGHTINAHTGYPVYSPTLSATVVASSCALADALATACMAMPDSMAINMIEQYPGVEALLVISKDSTYQVRHTPSFPEIY